MDRDLSKTSSNGRKFKRFMATLLSVAMIVLELPAMAVPTMAATKVQAASNEANVTVDETTVNEAVNNETSSEEAQALEDGIEEASTEELESYQGASIGITDDQDHVGFFTVNGGVATAVETNTLTRPTEEDFVIYAVPMVGYSLADDPVTVAGTYYDSDKAAHEITKDTDYTITDPAEKDVTDNPVSDIPLQSTLEDGKYYWNDAQMITIKSAYLDAYEENKGNTGEESEAATAISLTLKAVTATKIALDIYTVVTEDETTTYTKVNRMDSPEVTYGEAGTNISVADALSSDDWANYSWTIQSVIFVKDANGKITDTTDGTGCTAGDQTTQKISITADGIKDDYLTQENSLGTKQFGIALIRSANATADKYTVSNDDTNEDFAGIKFFKTVSEVVKLVDNIERAADETTDIVYDSEVRKGTTSYEGAANIAYCTPYGEPATEVPITGFAGEASIERTIANLTDEGTGGLEYTLAGVARANPEYALVGTKWTIPAGEGDVVAKINTRETVIFRVSDAAKNNVVVSLDGSNMTGAGTGVIDFNSKSGIVYSGVTKGFLTGSDLAFSVLPKAGYTLDADSVKVTRYSVDGTSIDVNESALTPTDSNYTVEGLYGLTIVDIDAQNTQLIGVKLDKSYDGLTFTDLNTSAAITSSSQALAASGKKYEFKVAVSNGYVLSEVKASTQSGTTTKDITVNAGTKDGYYYIDAADVTGALTLSATVTKALTFSKSVNEDAKVLVDGSELSDTNTVTVAGDAKVTLKVTPNNDAEVTGVYISNAVITNVTGLASATRLPELSSTIYEIPEDTVKNYTTNYSTVYVYVTTERDAVQKSDGSGDYKTVVMHVNGTGDDDIVEEISLYAGGIADADGVATLNNVVWQGRSGDDLTVAGSDESISYALTKEDDSAVVTVATGTITSQTAYTGGDATSVTDTLTITAPYTDDETFTQTVNYTATLPITVKPLRDYYPSYKLACTREGADDAGLDGNRIRVNTEDTATFKAQGVDSEEQEADLDSNNAIVDKDGVEYTGKKVKFTTTPKMNSAALYAEYKLDGGTESNVVVDYDATISLPKKVQTITVDAVVNFKDGTTKDITDTLDVVAEEYGYFAVPTTTVSGTATVHFNTDGTINIETAADGATSASLEYDVFKAVTSAGADVFTDGNLAETTLEAAITAGTVAEVNTSDVTWTSLEGSDGISGTYYNISGSNGSYTIKALKKMTDADELELTAKVGNYNVNMCKATGSSDDVAVKVNVAQKTNRYDVKFLTQDALGSLIDAEEGTSYKYPILDSYTGYTLSEILGSGETADKQVGTAILALPENTTIALPTIENFDQTTIDPKRTLVGWKIDSTYYLPGADATTETGADTTVEAIWAYKYAAKTATTTDGVTYGSSTSGTHSDAQIGNIGVVNKTKEAIVTANQQIAKGETLSLVGGYYALDTTEAPSAEGVTYAGDLNIIPTSKLTLSTDDDNKTVSKSVLGSNDDGTFTDCVVSGLDVRVTPIPLTLKYTESDGVEYTPDSIGVSVSEAEEWTVEVADEDIEVENTQTTTVTLKTLKKDSTDVNFKTIDAIAAYATDVTFTYAPEDVATVRIASDDDATANKLTIEGLKEGTTAVTMKIITTGNKVVTKTFNVNVTAAAVNIAVEVTPVLEDSYKEFTATKIAEGDTAQLYIGANGNSIKVTAMDGTDPTGKSVIPDATISSVGLTIGEEAKTIAATETSNVYKNTDALGFGEGTLTITVTSGGRTYTREIDVVTYSVVKLYGPLEGSESQIQSQNQSNVFKVYNNSEISSTDSSAGLVGAGTIAYIPVVYVDEETTSYTVSDIADYLGVWSPATDDIADVVTSQDFLGWGATNAACDQTTCAVAAGKTLTLTSEDAATDKAYYAYFAAKPIDNVDLGGVSKIVLTDEDVTADVAIDTTEEKSYWAEYEFGVTPASSNEAIKVTASEAGLFDIASKGQASDTGIGKTGTDSGETLFLVGTENTTPWNGSVAFQLAKNGASETIITSTADSRIDTLRIGKIAGKVGEAKLYIETASKSYDPITVVLNGEYTKDDKIYYMENGENLVNAAREVGGETHYYGETGAKITENGPAYIVDEEGTGHWILIYGGKQVTKVGKRAIDDVYYYVGTDGYLMSGKFAGVDTKSGDTDNSYYAYGDAETAPALTISDFADVDSDEKTATINYFDNNGYMKTGDGASFTTIKVTDSDSAWYGEFDYVIATDGLVAVSQLVGVSEKQYLVNELGQKVTYAMTKAAGTEGKATVNGDVYIIDEDDTAELEDRQYFVSISWSEWPETFKVADGPNITATATVYSEKQQKQLTGQEVVVTLSSNSTGLGENNVFYTATADLSKYYADSTYTEKAKNITIEETYIVEDGVATIADKRYVKSFAWSAWPETFDTTKGPGLTATLVVYSENQKKELTVTDVAITYETKSTGLGENQVFYTATADLSKYYADSTYTKKAENATTENTYVVIGEKATLADKKLVTKVSSFSWTPSANKDYTTSSTVTATVTVSYKLEKAGTTGSEVISATVQEISNSNKKIVYQATVDPSGYYNTDGTAYDWTKVTATKTYTVNEGGQGVSDGITVEGIEDEYYYTGVAIKPVVTVTDATADKVLVLGTDYTVKYQNNTKVGTATVIITGKGNYDKQAVTKTFKIVDPMEGETATDYYEVKSVKYDKETLVYDGTAKAPSKLTIATKEGVTVTATWNGSDYDIAVPDVDGAKTVRVVVANNVNKGSGTIAVYGSKTDRPVKKNFSIKAADMSTLGDKITVNAEAAPYSKKGAKAEVSVTFENGAGETVDLVEGRDFTVKYGYTNKKNAGEKAGTVTITGKNNFSKKVTTLASFDIEKLEISESNIIVDAYEKVAPKSLKVKVFDEEGEEVNNKSYSIVKITKDDADITTSKVKLVAGDDIYVTVKGDGVNLADDEVELEVKVGTKLSSAKFNAKSLTKTYEGTPIELDDSDLEKVAVTVKINKVETTLVAGEDYEIVGYKNNNKKGNMTVFVKGIGDKVSGYAKFTVKVNAKELKEAE